jgi:hypothetical protein
MNTETDQTVPTEATDSEGSKPKKPRAPRAPKPEPVVSDHRDARKVAEHAAEVSSRVGALLEQLPERDVRRVAFRRDAADLASVVRGHGELVAKREAAIVAHNEAMRLLGLEIDDAKALVVAFEGRVEQLAGRQAR